MSECLHGFPEGQCADCLALDRPGERAYGFHTFPAAYAGKCHTCGEAVREDDPIVGVADGDGQYVGYAHAEHREGM